MNLRKPVLEHMCMENVSFGHHLGHILGMNGTHYQMHILIHIKFKMTRI